MKLTRQSGGVWVKASEELPLIYGNEYYVKDSKGVKGIALFGRPDTYYDGKKREWMWENDMYKNDVIEWLKPIEQVYIFTEDQLEEFKRGIFPSRKSIIK